MASPPFARKPIETRSHKSYWERVYFRSRWLLFLAALSTVAAIITGQRQEDDVEGPALKQVFEVHEALGWSVSIGLWVAWLLSFIKSSHRWLWFLLLLLAVAILLEGNLGGVLAHMQL